MRLREAKKIGLKEVVVTCFEDHRASKKIIEASGGVLADKVILPKEDNRVFLKYIIKL